MNTRHSRLFVHFCALSIAAAGAGTSLGGTLYLMSMPAAAVSPQVMTASGCIPPATGVQTQKTLG